jgi:hypothetical protein
MDDFVRGFTLTGTSQVVSTTESKSVNFLLDCAVSKPAQQQVFCSKHAFNEDPLVGDFLRCSSQLRPGQGGSQQNLNLSDCIGAGSKPADDKVLFRSKRTPLK